MTNKLKDEAAKLGAEAKAAMANATTQPTEAQIADMTAQITQQATLASVNHTFMVATIISFVALVLSLFLKRVIVKREGNFEAKPVEKVQGQNN